MAHMMESDAAVLRDTEYRRLGSLIDADMDVAGALHADDYQLITTSGHAMTKREYLCRVASGRLRYEVFEPVSDIVVRVRAEMAVLRYQARISMSEDDGAAATVTCWHTDCYELRAGRWQVVWSQATAITPDNE